MRLAVKLNSPDMIIHLGDCVRDARELAQTFPHLPVCMVKGNCDVGSDVREKAEFTYAGKKFFIAHGHMYAVKFGYSGFINAAMCSGADIAMFGHTHSAYYERFEGLDVINPGSIGSRRRTYGLLTIENGVGSYKRKISDLD